MYFFAEGGIFAEGGTSRVFSLWNWRLMYPGIEVRKSEHAQEICMIQLHGR